jgi:hypothetical protein
MNAPRRSPLILAPTPQRWIAILAFALALVGTSVARANDHVDNPRRPDDLTPAEKRDPDEEEKPWQEQVIPLPPFPRAQDLIPFRADSGDPDYSYYIDVNSVSLAADEVLRYTVIIQSPVGSSNIIYEGIRCATEEVKMLAYGTRDGRFARMADAKWTFYRAGGAMDYRKSLIEMYVCDANGWAVDSDTVLERLVMHDPRRPRFVPKRAPSSD